MKLAPSSPFMRSMLASRFCLARSRVAPVCLRRSLSSRSGSKSSSEGSTSSSSSSSSLVVFDKDGTLIDFSTMWGHWIEQQAWQLEMTTKLPFVREKLFDAMGYDWIRRSIRSNAPICCTPMHQLFQLATEVLQGQGLTSHQSQQAITQCWQLPDPVHTSRPLTDLVQLFRRIRAMNVKIAVCTTDDRAPTLRTLQHLQLADLIDDVVCGDDGLPAKPAPEQLWTICQRLQVQPQNTMMVGDTCIDMQMAKSAGCGLAVGVLGGASTLEHLAEDADVLVPSLDKIPRVLVQSSRQTAIKPFSSHSTSVLGRAHGHPSSRATAHGQ